MLQGWLRHEPQLWRHDRIIGHADMWAYVLDCPLPAERQCLETTHPMDMTKIGCARFPEVYRGANRLHLWHRLEKPDLVAACGELPAAVVRARGRGGRGRAAAVGRARGRGGRGRAAGSQGRGGRGRARGGR